MHRLSDDALLACYADAIKFKADRKFIRLLLIEIKRRKLKLPPSQMMTTRPPQQPEV